MTRPASRAPCAGSRRGALLFVYGDRALSAHFEPVGVLSPQTPRGIISASRRSLAGAPRVAVRAPEAEAPATPARRGRRMESASADPLREGSDT